MKSYLYILTSAALRKRNGTLTIIPLADPLTGSNLNTGYVNELKEEARALNEEVNWNKGKAITVPIRRVDTIFALHPIQCNSNVLHLLSRHGISLQFFSYTGKYEGCYYSNKVHTKKPVLVDQVQTFCDERSSMRISGLAIRASIHNMRRLLRYYQRRDVDLAYYIDEMEHLERMAKKAQTKDELRGLEGRTRKLYYQGFDCCVKDEFKLKGRSFNPPKNIANALISYLNSLLYGTIQSELIKTGLNPHVGFLHSSRNTNWPLVYDIADIFRPLLADATALALIRRRLLKESHFFKEGNNIWINQEGRKCIINYFEKRLMTTIKHPRKSIKRSWRYSIRMEFQLLKKFLLEDISYEPFRHAY